MERGEVPRDFDLVGGMIRNICYANVREYLALPMKGIRAAAAREAIGGWPRSEP